MKYFATLREDQPLDKRSLFGLGRFERGEGREVDLTLEQVTSLTSKGFDLEPLEDDEDPRETFLDEQDADDEPREGE